MQEKKYYDGTKLLSLRDLNNNIPAIYMSTSNRSAGKTTYFSKLLVNRYLKTGKKFGLIYRYKKDLGCVDEKFFKNLKENGFEEYDMAEKVVDNGTFSKLYLNEEECGYAIPLNAADDIKKLSHLLSDTSTLFFDEFQSETNNYCPLEIKKLISIYTSIARGQGEQAKHIPLYMASNNISLLNPYFTEFGVSERLRDNTKFLRGSGWVLEANFNKFASEAMKQSPFMQAFGNNSYVDFNTKQGIYLNDNKAFIEKMHGRSRYICTLQYQNHNYSIREYAEQGIMYCDEKYDSSYPIKISVTVNDHDINYVMLQRYQSLILYMRSLFEQGCFRFKNLKCKEVILNTLAYH